jgi:hypothetical protein
LRGAELSLTPAHERSTPMRDAKYRAAAAEAEIHDIARRAKEAIGKMESRSVLLEAAMRVIMKRGLLNEFSQELNHPSITSPDTNGVRQSDG